MNWYFTESPFRPTVHARKNIVNCDPNLLLNYHNWECGGFLDLDQGGSNVFEGRQGAHFGRSRRERPDAPGVLEAAGQSERGGAEEVAAPGRARRARRAEARGARQGAMEYGLSPGSFLSSIGFASGARRVPVRGGARRIRPAKAR